MGSLPLGRLSTLPLLLDTDLGLYGGGVEYAAAVVIPQPLTNC
jgi:hypothetical protein